MSFAFHNYGTVKSTVIADRVKNLTFHYATKSGISISIEDLRVPEKKYSLIGLTTNEVENTEQNYKIGNITNVERFQKVIDIWNNASNFLKEEITIYFRESDPLNSLYIMAFSGARGNISQVRQLVGMRGLMADPQGQIIDLPIRSNFREGLTVTEYIISSYGARKGLVDTALRTADSGYLTRRLVDVAQDIIIREEDCQTRDGLSKDELSNNANSSIPFKDRMVGRLLVNSLTLDKEKTTLPINTVITNDLLTKFNSTDLEKVRIRSPLTCNSIRSICRNCYGWQLAYSKLVDLGEAVGIIAAQSIGEPGTQLTMRTFHTGGVFSGDLTKQIRSPFSGTLKYKATKNAILARTLHGERSFLIKEPIELYIENIKGSCSKIDLPENATLLVNNGCKVYADQIIAEIKKDANLILEEDSKTIYTDFSGQVFFQNIEIEQKIDKQGNLTYRNKNAGLIWVLEGECYPLPTSSEIIVKLGQISNKNSIIAYKPIYNAYPGIVKFNKLNEINILVFSLVLKNTATNQTLQNSEENIVTIDDKNFHLEVQHNKIISSGQTIATLDDDSYKTMTGGIVTYNLEKKFGTKKRSGTEKLFSGSLYWIPEEVHVAKNTNILYKIKHKNGTFVSKGTEILPKKFTKISGILELNFTTQELTIKPGELFKFDKNKLSSLDKVNGFVKPGEEIIDGIIAQKLTYIEFIQLNKLDYILARSVEIYNVPREKGFTLQHSFFPNINKNNIKIKTIKKIFYKNWTHIKSDKHVDLLKTFIVLDLNNKNTKLQPRLEFLQDKKHPDTCKIQISLYETIKIEDLTSSYNQQSIKSSIKPLVKTDQYVNSHSKLAQLEIFLPKKGRLISINNTANSKEILILRENSIKRKRHHTTIANLNIKIGDLIRTGSQIATGINSEYSGQIYNIDENYVYIRLGQPYLISEGAILEVDSNSLVQRLDKLATLIYEKLKTVDIVQGLPKVEEILEARKIKKPCILAPHAGYANFQNSQIKITGLKNNVTYINVNSRTKVRFSNADYIKLVEPLTDGPISPHDKLKTLFEYYYYNEKLPVNEACRLSFKRLQLFLVHEVQQTYLAQNVQIADKHVEIIIKQMTSKVRIDDNGETTLLPGELLNLYQAELITKATIANGDQPPSYTPILLGITKASLNSDSFISAASFQETTRVLTEAAIEGKKDWLRGLKENVIIGRLIPAGTGFKYYKNCQDQTSNKNYLDNNLHTKVVGVKDSVLKSRLNRLSEKS